MLDLRSFSEFTVAGRRSVIAGDFRVELDLTSQVLAIGG